MITIKKMIKLIIISFVPLVMYEIGTIAFYLFMLGSVSWRHIHMIAWSQDLAVFLPVLCFAIMLYYVYALFFVEEESKIDVPRYERPKYEKYDEPTSSGF